MKADNEKKTRLINVILTCSYQTLNFITVTLLCYYYVTF
jgi:hypothetical protein